jgi:hypothetical protein
MNLPLKIESSMLSAQDWSFMTSLSPELSKAYASRQIFRTETEARVSVLDDIHFPTKASKYWQCIREQTVMLEQLAILSFEYRRNETAIKRKETVIAMSADTLDIEDARIDLDECIFKRANMMTVAADRAREISMWSMLKSEIDDGSFDTVNVNTHQLISYTTQFALRASHANPATMSSGEMDNLAGQLTTSLKRCKDLGVLSDLRVTLPKDVVNQLQLEKI